MKSTSCAFCHSALKPTQHFCTNCHAPTPRGQQFFELRCQRVLSQWESAKLYHATSFRESKSHTWLLIYYPEFVQKPAFEKIQKENKKLNALPNAKFPVLQREGILDGHVYQIFEGHPHAQPLLECEYLTQEQTSLFRTEFAVLPSILHKLDIKRPTGDPSRIIVYRHRDTQQVDFCWFPLPDVGEVVPKSEPPKQMSTQPSTERFQENGKGELLNEKTAKTHLPSPFKKSKVNQATEQVMAFQPSTSPQIEATVLAPPPPSMPTPHTQFPAIKKEEGAPFTEVVHHKRTARSIPSAPSMELLPETEGLAPDSPPLEKTQSNRLPDEPSGEKTSKTQLPQDVYQELSEDPSPTFSEALDIEPTQAVINPLTHPEKAVDRSAMFKTQTTIPQKTYAPVKPHDTEDNQGFSDPTAESPKALLERSKTLLQTESPVVKKRDDVVDLVHPKPKVTRSGGAKDKLKINAPSMDEAPETLLGAKLVPMKPPEPKEEAIQLQAVPQALHPTPSATVTIEQDVHLPKKASLRYARQMNPNKVFLLEIKLQHEHFKHPQGGSTPDSTFIELVPIFPGCMVSPSRTKVDIDQPEADAQFWITPLVSAESLHDTKLQLWHKDHLKAELRLPVQIRSQNRPKVFMALAMLFSWMQIFDLAPSPAKSTSATPSMLEALNISLHHVGQFCANYGVLFGIAFMVIAGFLFQGRKPKPAKITEYVLNPK